MRSHIVRCALQHCTIHSSVYADQTYSADCSLVWSMRKGRPLLASLVETPGDAFDACGGALRAPSHQLLPA